MMPGARAVLRRLVDLGGTGTYDEFREHLIGRPERPMPQGQIGGKLTSIRAVRRGIGPNNKINVLSSMTAYASTGSSSPSWTA
ncbi:hypothetical protein ACWEWG_00580 [Streptomyces sp. NPDC003758]